MTAAAMQQTPVVPPRPSRSADKDLASGAIPRIPPRPVNKRLERSVSPNADRFAPSPLNEGIIAKSTKGSQLSPFSGYNNKSDDPIERASSVNLPSVGEEGAEYGAVAEELEQEQAKSRSASPEQTRTVADDLQLHAPKPSLPARSAKQRVMAVTRTDSDKAASYGFGRPAEDRSYSQDGNKKRTSSIFSNGSDVGQHTDDEHGIPEIGQRVPMNPNLGDVQAPSPGPGSDNGSKRHHRKHSSRSLPPGSYGLHGHGVAPQDKLEKAYYEKHPDLLEREHHTPLHDRQNDFAMSSNDLNKLVRDTASRAAGMGTSAELRGTPTDEAAFQASEEYASRISSPRPASTAPKSTTLSHLSQSHKPEAGESDDYTIHVEGSKHPEFRSYGEPGDEDAENGHEYTAPILAADEVGKSNSGYLLQPAVHPGPERRGSAFEMEDAPSQPTSRPPSIHLTHTPREFDSTPLEDVKEYEPLFTEDSKQEREKQDSPDDSKSRRQFPSKDIWEDAPNSVHFTAEVNTPDVSEPSRRKSSTHHQKRPITPAQAFALHQEELAEKEAKGQTHTFLPLSEEKPSWAAHQQHLKAERPQSAKRFPSRDVWEDAPESQLHQTVLTGSGSSAEEESKPEIPVRPTKKSESSERPVIPERPKPKQAGDEPQKSRPPISEKPKPQVPTRPSKSSSGDSKDGELSKPKPPVPSRPVGGKIAALQAGFMSDLNKRLQIGPQAVKKEEAAEQEAVEEKEKVPLSDARKGRARGPQRRAPAKSPAPVTASSVDNAKPAFTFSIPMTTWTIDPEDGNVAVLGEAKTQDVNATEDVPKQSTELQPEPEKVLDQQEETEPRDTATEDKVEEVQDQAKDDQPAVEEKTLVANTAGESILEETVAKNDDEKEVEPVAVSDDVKA